MTTVINNPSGVEGEGSGGVGIIIGIIMFIVVVGLFFVYVLPKIQGAPAQPNSIDVNVKLPAGDTTNSQPAQ